MDGCTVILLSRWSLLASYDFLISMMYALFIIYGKEGIFDASSVRSSAIIADKGGTWMDDRFLAVLGILLVNVVVINSIGIGYVLICRSKGAWRGSIGRWFLLNLGVYSVLALFLCWLEWSIG